MGSKQEVVENQKTVFVKFEIPFTKVTRRPAFGGTVPILNNLSRGILLFFFN